MPKDRAISFTLGATLLVILMLAGCGMTHKRVTEKDRLTATSYYQLAVNYYSQNQIIEALEALKDAEGYNAQDAQVQNLYGLIYLYKRMPKEAEASFQAALKYDPAFSDASLNLAAVYMDQEKWALAQKALKLPASDLLYRDKDKVFDNLGWCYHKLGDAKRAIENLNAATMQNERNCHAWYNLGQVYEAQGSFAEAASAYGKVTTYCPQDLVGHYRLGLMAKAADDPTTARTALERCVSLGKDAPLTADCRRELKGVGAKPN